MHTGPDATPHAAAEVYAKGMRDWHWAMCSFERN
jgi:hypothetical protein